MQQTVANSFQTPEQLIVTTSYMVYMCTVHFNSENIALTMTLYPTKHLTLRNYYTENTNGLVIVLLYRVWEDNWYTAAHVMASNAVNTS